MDLLELWRSEIDAECAVDLPELWKPQIGAFPNRIIDRYVLIWDTLDGLPLRSTLTMPMRTSLVVTKPDGLYEAPIGPHMGLQPLQVAIGLHMKWQSICGAHCFFFCG